MIGPCQRGIFICSKIFKKWPLGVFPVSLSAIRTLGKWNWFLLFRGMIVLMLFFAFKVGLSAAWAPRPVRANVEFWFIWKDSKIGRWKRFQPLSPLSRPWENRNGSWFVVIQSSCCCCKGASRGIGGLSVVGGPLRRPNISSP